MDNDKTTKKEAEWDPDNLRLSPEADRTAQELLNTIARDLDHLKEKYPGAWAAMFEEDKKREFAESITVNDLRGAFPDEPIPAFLEKAFSGTDTDEKLEALRYMSLQFMLTMYEYKHREEKKTYRTRKRTAGIGGPLPDCIPAITNPNYKYATSLYDGKVAFIKQVREEQMKKLQWDEKRQVLSFQGVETITEARLKLIGTNDKIGFIDLPFLKMIYGLIYAECQGMPEQVPKIIKKRIPDLAQYMGIGRNIDEGTRQRIIGKMQQFQRIIGVMETSIGAGRRPGFSIYPVLLFAGYNAADDTIEFVSPYLNQIISRVYELSIRRDRYGHTILKTDGTPARLPSHSYLIKSEIAKEQNKRAAENVFIIVQVIETAGNNNPHISIKELIRRNPQLEEALKESKNPRQLLQRNISKTLELLHTRTRLEEYYPGIKLPDRKDPANIPNMSNLNLVLEFPHNGKKTAKEPEKEVRKRKPNRAKKSKSRTD